MIRTILVILLIRVALFVLLKRVVLLVLFIRLALFVLSAVAMGRCFLLLVVGLIWKGGWVNIFF